mmetsp:Transcript_15204/g.45851  ORF Transcript_15204/g.45851 Transcript_15204/m.45851 type:complete len:157 (-) Transcript_15204:1873-2343(-)|eukprot:CAMPEP_0206139068 /NCGR_PEP_ID=MMETSP1473-20131121/4647_1 /ASSEMBLY_ACC=CAM_ASM_001109 /TAXON_ID=1461547 /ORGANISM="Stichococcus sp, Strain RCC1054" /LENGTH=156 /DNA_ID=CAMNT_0053532695 /DNA_START=198 /DNA_END=668 /DNA_ORIENTATION=-
MAWTLLIYFIAFVIEAALMGIMMYQLIKLSDLENDFINPHDATAALNKVVFPEFGLQALMTLLMLLSGRWFIGSLHVLVLAFNVREVMLQRHHVDVTEVFRDLNRQKTIRNIKLALYVLIFVVVIYKLVETAVETLLTPEGRVHAAHIMKQAAADM